MNFKLYLKIPVAILFAFQSVGNAFAVGDDVIDEEPPSRSITVNPATNAFNREAEDLLEARDNAGAVRLLENQLQSSPASLSWRDLRNLSTAHHNMGDHARSVQLAEEILTKFPDECDVTAYRGALVMNMQAENWARAAEIGGEMLTRFPAEVDNGDRWRIEKARSTLMGETF